MNEMKKETLQEEKRQEESKPEESKGYMERKRWLFFGLPFTFT